MKDRIRKVREENGLSLTRFAEKLGLTVSSISCYESGKRTPTNSVLTSISKEFNVSYAWLKTGEGPMEDPAMQDETVERLAKTYRSLPDRLRALVDALTQMDSEWYKTLDAALAEIDRRKNEGDAG